MNTDKPFELWWMPYPQNPCHVSNKLIDAFDSLEEARDALVSRAKQFGNNQKDYEIKTVFTKNDLGDIFP